MANIYNVLFLNLSHKVSLGKTVCVSVSFGKGVKKEDFKQVCDAKHRLVKSRLVNFSVFVVKGVEKIDLKQVYKA